MDSSLDWLLRDMDPDAEEVANTLRQHIGVAGLQPLAQELVRQLAKFDFDSAGHTLNQLKAELEGKPMSNLPAPDERALHFDRR